MSDQAPQFWVDGTPSSTVPVTDLGLNAADGVFRTLLAHEGQVDDSVGQFAVLQHAVTALALAPVDWDALQRTLDTAARSIGTGMLKALITRGDQDRRRPSTSAVPRAIVQAWPTALPDISKAPVDGVWASRVRVPAGADGPVVKTLARIPQQRAFQALNNVAREAALLSCSNGALACAHHSNLFVSLDGQWVTPPVSDGALPGRMRARVLGAVSISEQSLVPEALLAADAVLLSNSVWGVWALASVAVGDQRHALEPQPALLRQLWASIRHPVHATNLRT